MVGEKYLMKRLKRGEEAALRVLIGRYGAYVGYIVENICGQAVSREDKEEIVSNVFLSLWTHREQVNAENFDSLKPYLGSIARNMSKNVLRGLPRVYHEELDSCIFLQSGQDVEKETMQRVIRDCLMECILELPETDRLCMIAYYYYEKTLSVIAKEQNLSENTVKSKLFRGRKKLKAKLKERGIDYEDFQNYFS